MNKKKLVIGLRIVGLLKVVRFNAREWVNAGLRGGSGLEDAAEFGEVETAGVGRGTARGQDQTGGTHDGEARQAALASDCVHVIVLLGDGASRRQP